MSSKSTRIWGKSGPGGERRIQRRGKWGTQNGGCSRNFSPLRITLCTRLKYDIAELQQRKSSAPEQRLRKRVEGHASNSPKEGERAGTNVGGEHVETRSTPRQLRTRVLLFLPELARFEEQPAREERVREVLVHHLGDLRPRRVEDVLPPLRGRLQKAAFVSDLSGRKGSSTMAFKRLENCAPIRQQDLVTEPPDRLYYCSVNTFSDPSDDVWLEQFDVAKVQPPTAYVEQYISTDPKGLLQAAVFMSTPCLRVL